jgi:hypothetical protein
MKNIKIVALKACIALMLSLMFFTSCSDDDKADAGSITPVIESVMRSGYDENDVIFPLDPVTVGIPKNYYIIHGKGLLNTEKVYFNDYDTYFQSTFVTDTDIIILIDEKTPYANASNQLKVVTKSGTVIYDFVIAPPTPTFKTFAPINAAEGTEVTIYGNYFLNPVVTIAATETEPAINVPVVSSTLEKIVVRIPANAQRRYITVANISGSETSKEAIGTAIYDDVFYNPWTIESWNNFSYKTDATAQQGFSYIRKTYDAWASMQGNWAWVDNLPAEYGGIRISVRGSKPGTLKFIFNGDWSERNMLDVKTEWTTYDIPWSALGNPTFVQNISYQNMSKDGNDGIENTIDIDNLGYFLKK